MYLDALSDLVAACEETHYSIAPASDAEMLRHLLEAKGITQAELHRETGLAKSSISEVLAGRKPFSRQMIRTLAADFRVDVGLLASNLQGLKKAVRARLDRPLADVIDSRRYVPARVRRRDRGPSSLGSTGC